MGQQNNEEWESMIDEDDLCAFDVVNDNLLVSGVINLRSLFHIQKV